MITTFGRAAARASAAAIGPSTQARKATERIAARRMVGRLGVIGADLPATPPGPGSRSAAPRPARARRSTGRPAPATPAARAPSSPARPPAAAPSDVAAAACPTGSRTHAPRSGARRAIGQAAVPQVGVDHRDRPRPPRDQHLVGMGPPRVGRRVLRQAPPAVRPRHDAQGAVVRREVVEHPDGVAHPVALLIRQGRHVDVQRLAVAPGQRRPCVQAAELEPRAEDVAHAGQDPGLGDDAPEHLPLVDQVGQPQAPRLLLELGAGAVALEVVEPATWRRRASSRSAAIAPGRTRKPSSSSRARAPSSSPPGSIGRPTSSSRGPP